MGIILCPTPQISAQAPQKEPTKGTLKVTTDNIPGLQSIFTPKPGRDHL